MPSGYQRLVQSVDEEAEVGASSSSPTQLTRGVRRAPRPGHIDLSKLDTAFKR
jgi:hypothetical protein